MTSKLRRSLGNIKINLSGLKLHQVLSSEDIDAILLAVKEELPARKNPSGELINREEDNGFDEAIILINSILDQAITKKDTPPNDSKPMYHPTN